MQHHNFIICNGDTDAIAFKRPNESAFTEEEQAALLAEINSLMPDNIVWTNDKHYRRFIVCGAKNYIMDDGKKIKIKGSGLKASKKEQALKEFTTEVCHLLVQDRKDQVLFLYLQKAREILSLTDVSRWCFKVTVTKKVLDPQATFQKKQAEAIGSFPVSEGDKVYMFFREDGSLCLRENFNADIDQMKLLKKLRDTIDVFSKVFDVELFPDLTLRKNKELLNSLRPPATTLRPPVGQLLTRAN